MNMRGCPSYVWEQRRLEKASERVVPEMNLEGQRADKKEEDRPRMSE